MIFCFVELIYFIIFLIIIINKKINFLYFTKAKKQNGWYGNGWANILSRVDYFWNHILLRVQMYSSARFRIVNDILEIKRVGDVTW